MGQRGAPLLSALLHRVGEICAGVFDGEDEDRGDGGVGAGTGLQSLRSAAVGCLGAAVRYVGPEAVLQALPLNLEEVRVRALLRAVLLLLVLLLLCWFCCCSK